MSDAAAIRDADARAPDQPAPAWEQITHDVRCPLCDYNLRGLPHPRCPECGGRFTWRELLETASTGHPCLFELHPERNVRAYLRTALGAMLPRRFWTQVSPVLPVRRRRLIAYWAIGACLAFLISLPACAAFWLHSIARYGLLPGRPGRTAPGWPAGRGSSWITVAFSGGSLSWSDLGEAVVEAIPRTAQVVGFFLAWGLLTLAVMQIFRVSMRRARIRTAHILRTVVYSFDPFLWGLVSVALFAWLAIDTGIGGSAGIGHVPPELVLPAGVALCGWRFYRAYRHYLRFDRPFCTVLAGQIIVLLLMANLLFFTGLLT